MPGKVPILGELEPNIFLGNPTNFQMPKNRSTVKPFLPCPTSRKFFSEKSKIVIDILRIMWYHLDKLKNTADDLGNGARLPLTGHQEKFRGEKKFLTYSVICAIMNSR